jgi:hypothetical protein
MVECDSTGVCILEVVVYLWFIVIVGILELIFIGVTFFMFFDFRRKARNPFPHPMQGFFRIHDPVLTAVNSEPLYAINTG